MGTTADKLNKILDSKARIKAAIEAKGVSDVGDVLANYPDKIASIQAGSSTGFTGHADVEGLKAIGWTDKDIEHYQKNGVNWNEEDDEYHKVPQDNIDLYGVLTSSNIPTYKDIIVYLPKIDTSGINDMSNKFKDCRSMVSIPLLDTSSATTMTNMFANCYSLVSIPLLDTSSVTNMNYMFMNCYSLVSIPLLDTSSVTNMYLTFSQCYSLVSIPLLNTESNNNFYNTFMGCSCLTSIPSLDMGNSANSTNTFKSCYSIRMLKIKKLKISLDISLTSLLTKDSLLYIIENAAPAEPITITLSAYCYNKYNADEDIVAALAKQPNVSLASA